MQLRNGKSTVNRIRCTAQKASPRAPFGAVPSARANGRAPKSYVSHATYDHTFSVSELSGMICESNLRHKGTYQRSHGLCEIYDYLYEHLEAIRELKGGEVLKVMRNHTIKLVGDAAKGAIRDGKDPDTLESLQMLTAKMLAVLAKMGPE